jgi:hypothetical protein
MPASPPPTSSHSSRSTPSRRPAATGCSPRPPAAAAPTALSSSRSWTSCAPGDTLVVWKLDRLGRSLRHLVETVTGLAARGIGFRSLQEAIDTTTPGGKLVFHVFAALAEFERDLIRERTAAGLAAARARGRRGGRPSVLTGHKLQVAQQMYRSGQYTVAATAKTLGISRPRSTGTSLAPTGSFEWSGADLLGRRLMPAGGQPGQHRLNDHLTWRFRGTMNETRAGVASLGSRRHSYSIDRITRGRPMSAKMLVSGTVCQQYTELADRLL